MNASKVTDELVRVLGENTYDLIICNFANADMVGHTGIFSAAVTAVETLDVCLGRIEAALTQTGGQMLITADHGNVERMRDHGSGQAHTAHTNEPVPLVYLGPKSVKLSANGTLSDVAPTVLDLMQLEKPGEMTGNSLAQIEERRSA
jgi:2,3-bisphosphoglycerate-independent phosphoglycerate mutase